MCATISTEPVCSSSTLCTKPRPRRAERRADVLLWLRAASLCSYPLVQGTHAAKADPPSKSVLYFSPPSSLPMGREAVFEQSMLNRFSVYSHPRSDCLKQNLPNSSHCIQTGALFFHPSFAWVSPLLLFSMDLDPTCSLKASFHGCHLPGTPLAVPICQPHLCFAARKISSV